VDLRTVTRFSSVPRLSAPAAILACALFLPFLNKAFLVDDPYFLLQAEQVRHEFLHPLNFNICWFVTWDCAPAYKLAPGAALMGYFLAPVIRVAALEPVVHLLQLVVLLAAVAATVSLALRWGVRPAEARVAGLLLVTFPPVLALTDTAMPDTLAMSLGVIGLERFSAWMENRKAAIGAAAALALGLAPFARLHAIGFIALGAVAAILPFCGGRRPLNWTSVLPLLAAGAMFLALSYFTREQSSIGPLPPEARLGLANIPRNARALFSYYVIAFPVAALWLISERRRSGWIALYAGAAFVVCVELAKMRMALAATWMLAALGGLYVALELWRGARARTPNLLLAGLWLLMPCAVLPYFQLPPKYLIASAPAAAILGATCFTQESSRFRRLVLTASIVIFAIASVLILRADARFADMPRSASQELIAPYVIKGEKVWFIGEWGLYWYAQQAGARVVITGTSMPQPGDLLVTGEIDGGSAVLQLFPRKTLIADRIFAWTGGRTMSFADKAGLYSNIWGPLPWSWGSGEVDRFQLWRVEEPASLSSAHE